MFKRLRTKILSLVLVLAMSLSMMPIGMQAYAQDNDNSVTPTATVNPTVNPTVTPTVVPTVTSTVTPTVVPTVTPTVTPTVNPTVNPTATPTVNPTVVPTVTPTVTPTVVPTVTPMVTSTPSPTQPPLRAEIEVLAEDIDVGEYDESYTGDINIYTTYGTLPTLYALLYLYEDIDEAKAENREPAKSYMWYLRGKTANFDKLPDNVELMMPLSEKQIYNADYAKKFMAYAKKLYKTYPNAHFNLYCDDLRAQEEILYFTFNGIPEEQYNVHLLSDGTGSYSFIKDYFYKDSVANGVEPVEGAKDKWNLYEYWYKRFKEEAKSGIVNKSSFLDNNMGVCYIMYAASSMDNIEYVLQWPELMISDDETVNQYLGTKMNRKKLFPSEIYAELTKESQDAFLNAVLSASNLTKAEFDETYLNGASDGSKKYMIISGTSPAGEGSIKFEDRVNNLIEYFGDEYTYLYKPHPSHPAANVSGRSEYLKSKGIVEMPAQTPMEVILTAYPMVDLGGYNSSLYMSATGKHVKFFFTDKFESLSAPLPDLYKLGMYPDAVLFNPEIVGIADIENNDGVLKIDVNVASKLILAGYNGDNYVDAKLIDLNVGENTVTLADYKISGSSKIKAMVWKNIKDLTPLSKTEEILLDNTVAE